MRLGPAFLQTFGSQAIQSAASILTGVLIARGLGPAGQGFYATFAAGVALGALVASVGQFHGNVLAVAQQKIAPRILLARAGIHGTLLLLVLLPTIHVWGQLTGLPPLHLLRILFAAVLVLEVVAQMVRGINLGQHHILGWNVATLVQRIVFLTGVTFLVAGQSMRLETVVACWAAGTLASVLVSGTWVWFRSPPIRLTARVLRSGWHLGLKQGMRAFTTIGLGLVLVRCDVWMLRWMLGVETVGQMSVATNLAEWLWYVPSILGNLLFAVVAVERSRRTALQVARSSRLVAGLMFLASAVLMPIGQVLVVTMYGPAYRLAGTLFVLVVPGAAALGMHLVIDAYFSGQGFPPISIWGALAAVAAKVALNLLLVPSFGAPGAAVATGLSYGGLLAIKIGAFVRQTGTPLRTIFLPTRSDFEYARSLVTGAVTASQVRAAGAPPL